MANRKITYAFLAVASTGGRIEWWEEDDNGVLVRVGRTGAWVAIVGEFDNLVALGQKTEMKFADETRLILTFAYKNTGSIRFNLWTRYSTSTTGTLGIDDKNQAGVRVAIFGSFVIEIPYNTTTLSNNAWTNVNGGSQWYSGTYLTSPALSAAGQITDLIISNDGMHVARIGGAADSTVHPWNGSSVDYLGYPSNWSAGFKLPGTNAAEPERFEAGCMSMDDSTLIAMTTDYRLFTWALEYPNPPIHLGKQVLAETFSGKPWRMAASRTGQFVAISTQIDVNTYATKVYKRTGGAFELRAEIAGNFGRFLDFSYDDKYLFDVWNRRVFDVGVDGTLTENTVLFQNLTTSDSTIYYGQAASHDLLQANPVATPRTYPQSISAMAEGRVNFDGLKLMLLTSDAVFDPAATDMTGLASHEVSHAALPSGGFPLEGRTPVEAAGYTGYTYDEIKASVFASLTFKSLVIYDPATDVPVMWATYESPVTIDSGYDLYIEPMTVAFILFDA